MDDEAAEKYLNVRNQSVHKAVEPGPLEIPRTTDNVSRLERWSASVAVAM